MADEVKSVEPPQGVSPLAPAREYEFAGAENLILADLARNLRVGGWGLIVAVVVYHLVLLGRWAAVGEPVYERFRVLYLWWPLMVLFFAALFIRAGRAFDRVVTTEGRDITNLMAGLRSLNEFFEWLPGVWWVLRFAALLGAVAATAHLSGY